MALGDAIERGQVPLSVNLEDLAADIPDDTRRLSVLQVSNNGILHPDIADTPGLRLVNVLMPTDSISASFPIYSVFTFRGQLSIRYLYPSGLFGEDEGHQIAARVKGHLDLS